ncbi:MAG: hypothetical protein J7M14_06160 [Planctomycetes bacterium]|nr:hypothetical protein [Planctomycetota bacterium]
MANRPQAKAITAGPKSHFFGYYDKFQIDLTATKMLTMEVDFEDRPAAAGDIAKIGVVDMSAGNKLAIVAETAAWSWQQSCMLQWLPGQADRKIIFNIRRENNFGCCVLDIVTAERRFYDRPVFAVSSDGRFALSAGFARMALLRPTCGYPGVDDPHRDICAPQDDGIYYLNLETGLSRMIISLGQIAAIGAEARFEGCKHWFNHLLLSPDNERFAFLHRHQVEPDARAWRTRLFTARTDGSNIHLLNDHEMTSHFAWRDKQTILAWARRFDTGNHYYYFTDLSDEVRLVSPQKLLRDGHMSYRPQGEWIVTDSYPDADRMQHLMLFNERTDELVELGRFHSPVLRKRAGNPCRCDLHPRWSRDGNFITFDSLHEGPRQVYMVDVGDIVGG